MSERSIFPYDLVVGKSRNGKAKFAVVDQVGGIEDSDDSSDSEDDEFSLTPLERGQIRVTWYPNGKSEVLQESELEVVDRSCLPRDVIRTKDGNQLGTTIRTKVVCDVAIVGTSKVLKGIDVSDLTPTVAFQEGDMVALGPWLGRVTITFENLLLSFSNGSSAKLDVETAESEYDLLDVYPHPSDDSSFVLSSYYPGQFLSGRAKAFENVKWVSGEEIKFRPKTRYKVLVEQIELTGLKVKWGIKAFSEDEKKKEIDVMAEDNVQKCNHEDGSSVDPEPPKQESSKTEDCQVEPPPEIIIDENLNRLRRMDHFWQGHTWLGDRFRLKINALQAEDVNKQMNQSGKCAKKMRMAKRMNQILHHSTSQPSLEATRSKKGRKKRGRASATSHQDSAEEGSGSEDDSHDGEEWENEEEDEQETFESVIPPSGGPFSSAVDDAENEIEVLVNNESDLNISSPIGQIPTILGMMSCRAAGFELDFTLVQENGISPKKRFQFNIQNPECSKETIESISESFQIFMKSMLKKHKHLLSTTSCAAMMSQCPQAIRTFVMQHSSLENQEIFFDYMADGMNTSGVINKDGQKTELQYENEDPNPLSMPQAVQMISEVFNSVLEPSNFFLTSGAPGKKQGGQNVKFHAGQWVTVEITRTNSLVDIQWQDGSVQEDVPSSKLLPAHHVDDNDFCPGDFITDNRVPEQSDYYGVVLKVDNQNRMAKIQWIRKGRPAEIEEVSSYEIADHLELEFRISDIIVRVSKNIHASLLGVKTGLTDKQAVGELLRITELGMLNVLWSDGTTSLVHPLDVRAVTEDDDEFESSDDDDEDASWTTASSDDEAHSVSSHESLPIGDAENPKPPIRNDPEFIPNHEKGEGFREARHNEVSREDDNHVNLEENIRLDVVELVEEITEATCKSADVRCEFNKPEKMKCDVAYVVEEITKKVSEPDKMHIGGSRPHQQNSQENCEVIVNQEDGKYPNEQNDGYNEKSEPAVEHIHGGIHELDENDNSAKNHDYSGELVKLEPESNEAHKGDVTATVSSESLPSVAQISSDAHSSFHMESSSPLTHHFAKRYFDQSPPKTFVKAVQRDLKMLGTSLSPGITAKAYEDRMDLLSVLIEGPQRTPYEDGIFSFDIYLSSNYPDSPPSVHYISFSPRLNPNLYETGRVCVSLLGTWSGKGSERWTTDSTILQLLLSLQGLILNSEPYYNEAGYEGHRGTVEGMKNSRCYNEMVILRLVQHMTSILQNPPEAFAEEVKKFCSEHVLKLLSRVENLLSESDTCADDSSSAVDNLQGFDVGFPLLPLSKGVMLSLKSRLMDLQSTAKDTGYL